ncbi:hypothetical protein [Nocardia acidivorans]|uniref:hypothetical protein n=1 Tax=Nocardia acidivorans TaxID=404580 RepID=UPI000833894A|nr:hypothetical protein [Nocardia acidivorans]
MNTDSVPCLLEHTPDRGLRPERMLVPTVGQALAIALDLTAPGPAEVRPEDLPAETVAITYARPDHSLPVSPDLYVHGLSDHVHTQVLAWVAADMDKTLQRTP